MNTPIYSAFLDRLNYFIKSQNLSLNKFGEMAGFSNGGINRVIKDKKGFGVDKLLSIFEKFPALNPLWLLHGEGNMLKNEDEADQHVTVDVYKLLSNGYGHSKEELIKGLIQLSKEKDSLLDRVLDLSDRVTDLEEGKYQLQRFFTKQMGLDTENIDNPKDD